MSAQSGTACCWSEVLKMRCKCRLTALALWLFSLSLNAIAGSTGASIDLQLSPSIGQTSSASLAQAPKPASPGSTEYQINTGDSVSVTVYQEPDLSISGVKVGTDGTIAFPLLGDLPVAGLSSRQIQKLVIERLEDGYLKSPSVTVSIDRYRLYFIKGEVNSPGGYNFVDGLTVEKAVALAGGFSERASEQDITLIRETQPDQPLKSVSPTTAILPGDVITIGESFF